MGSNICCFSEPAMPDNICKLSEITQTSMKLTWLPAQSSLPVFYTVQNGTVPLTNKASPFSITNLTPGKMYLFQVWATVTQNTSVRSKTIQCSNSTGMNVVKPKIILI